jgi:hypothetical protein
VPSHDGGDGLHREQTWRLVPLPPGHRPIGLK